MPAQGLETLSEGFHDVADLLTPEAYYVRSGLLFDRCVHLLDVFDQLASK